jgi:hypothetical protein
MKLLRGGQASTSAAPASNKMGILEMFVKFVMLPVIFFGIIRDFINGNTITGGILLFFVILLLFILYLTTLGAEYINNPNGYTLVKIILGVIMIFNTPAIFVSALGLLIIFSIVLSSFF